MTESVAGASTTAQPGLATELNLTFDQLIVGQRYDMYSGFVDSGMLISVAPFEHGNGSMSTNGYAEVQDRGNAGGSGSDIWTNNALLKLNFSGQVNFLGVTFGAYGGNINLLVNDTLVNVGTPEAISEQLPDDMTVDVVPLDDDTWLLTIDGPIVAFGMGGQEFAIDDILLQGEFQPLGGSRAAVRILLVTQDNRVGEYHVSIIPGIARGHPNQFNQWLVTILGIEKETIDIFGIWDPRLIIIHDIENAHSISELDSETAYLFDVVFPFAVNATGDIPVEVLLRDQELTLLADIDLRPAIGVYCESNFGADDPACQQAGQAQESAPISNVAGAPFSTRAPATIERTLWTDSPQVALCLPSIPPTQESLTALTEQCNLTRPE